MNNQNLKKQILSFLQSKFIAVIATVNQENQPNAATIYYITDDSFKIHFITKTDTTKYKNIENNPHVALVIGTENVPLTAQIEGTAQKVSDVKKIPQLLEKLAKVSNRGEYMAPAFSLSEQGMNIIEVSVTKIKWLDMKEIFSEHIKEEINFPSNS